ncbi:sulfate adenylyltransferase subunit CysD [Tenacibaculum dicentrarchi]|uniref:Sulfate adenylyltransferase subunit 2 n=1 Tax=Tenacibaculum dicentrarchi TaxID=669041 RepID=A0ABP1EI99_9FLAO|nr:sulfate adenylyltransferase subunit CysD [Tenacibaculum dicentrarchi]SOS52009.1 sulfate adenylyltransferase, subunit 2 [Tenacibaculum dicentrarchi]
MDIIAIEKTDITSKTTSKKVSKIASKTLENTIKVGALESEAIYIFREVVAQFEKPVLLFSGGKDSITLVRLAQKAFYPAKIPFPLMHIDTGHNFPETIEFRDRLAKELGVELIVRNVQDNIDNGKVKEETGKYASRNMLQTETLLDAIEEFGFDACIGGARRDEEKARAKERIFSVRDDFGQWDEKNQRPELFDILNGRIDLGQNVRVFPISNWTELDVWSYIQKEAIEIPSIYFAHKRKTFVRDGMIWSAEDAVVYREEDEVVQERMVRFRTVGDMSCTAAVLSDAVSIDKVVAEIKESTISERGARIDDKRSEAAMEKRKQQGYF